MNSVFLANLSRLSTDFTICCSKEKSEKKEVWGGRGGGVLENQEV